MHNVSQLAGNRAVQLLTGQSAHSNPSAPMKVQTMHMGASKLDIAAVEEVCMIQLDPFSFTSCGWLGVCALFTLRSDGTRMHWGKETSQWRECDIIWAMFCWETLCPGFHVDVNLICRHLPKHCCKPGTPLHDHFPRSQSYQASVGCAEKRSPIHSGLTSELTGFKGSAASLLVPDITEHLQSLVESMPQWVGAVLMACGAPTAY